MKRIKPYLFGGIAGIVILLAALSAYTVLASPEMATGCFSDTNGHWAEVFICFAEEYGIVGGYPDGTFKPENRVTRAETSVMFQNALKAIRGEGTAWGHSGGILLPTTVNSSSSGYFATVTLDAPSDGALLINGYLNIQLSGAGQESDGNAYIQVDGTRKCRQWYQLDGASIENASASDNIAMSTYSTVTGGTHTIRIELANIGPNSLGVWSGGLNVLFVPFDGTGTIANAVEDASLPGSSNMDQSNP